MSKDLDKTNIYPKSFKFSRIKEVCEDIVDNIPVGVFRLNPTSEGLFINVNEAFIKLFGFDTLEELIKFPVSQLYGESDAHKQICEISGTGIIYDKEISFRRKDGTIFWTSSCVNAIRNKSGAIEWVDGIIKDISQRKKLEEKLIESKERYQALFERSNDAVFIFDLNGICLDANKKGCDILGYSHEELIGLSDEKIVNQKDYRNNELIRSQIQKTDILPLYECYLRKKDGNKFPVEINLTLVRDSNGEPIYLQSIVRDISLRKKKELLQKELEEHRKKYIETTAHELRSPLTIIQGYIDLLKKREGELSEEHKIEYFSTINQNIERLTRLINEVADMAKLERKVFILNKEITNLISFFEHLITSYTKLLGNQIEFRSSCDFKPIFVNADKYRLNQVIDNIISNAVKHTDKISRKIIINLEITNANTITINISDNGAGIDQENIERIFEPFVSIASKYSSSGSGIGLYLSRAIIEKHGGRIYASSKGLDKGSSFIIDLPRITDDQIDIS